MRILLITLECNPDKSLLFLIETYNFQRNSMKNSPFLLFLLFTSYTLHSMEEQEYGLTAQLNRLTATLNNLSNNLLTEPPQSQPKQITTPVNLDQDFKPFKGTNILLLKEYITALHDLAQQKSIDPKKLFDLEEEFIENLTLLRDFPEQYNQTQQASLEKIKNYLFNAQNIKNSISKKLAIEEQKNRLRGFIRTEIQLIKAIFPSQPQPQQCPTTPPQPDIQPTAAFNELKFQQGYLADKTTYAQYINPGLRVPYTLSSGNQLQQIVTLNQFLTSIVFKNPNDDYAIQIQNITGMNTRKYIPFLLSKDNNQSIRNNLERNGEGNDYFSIGGGQASCAYQALRNVLILIEALQGPKGEYNQKVNELYYLKTANSIFGYPEVNEILGNGEIPGVWRKLIIQERANKGDDDPEPKGDWLDKNEIQFLINKSSFPLHPYKGNITVIEPEFDNLLGTAPFNDIKRKLATPGNFHVFIIFILLNELGRGHWFSLIVTSNNNATKTYTIADSLNLPRYPRTINAGAPEEAYSTILENIINQLESK